jgi:hypothetical protein
LQLKSTCKLVKISLDKRRIWLISIVLLTLGAVAAWAFFPRVDPLKKQLVGPWHAIQLTEESEPLATDLDPVCLQFNADDSYSFWSTLNYFECGKFDTKNQKLIISPEPIDTNRTTTQRSMDFTFLGQDTLELYMLEVGKPRTMTMVRE